MEQFKLCMTTCESQEQASTIAQALVESRLAACVNILPKMTSVYRWNEKICNESEVLLLIKTDEKKLTELTTLIDQLHTYDCPEVIHIGITGGSDKYLNWLTQELT